MPRRLAFLIAVTVAASGCGVAGHAAPLGTSANVGAGYMHGAGPAIRPEGAPDHSGASPARPGAGAGANYGNHESSGWYQRGFGGTRDPGWGYRFGPSLGGRAR